MITFDKISEQPETLIIRSNGQKVGQITQVGKNAWNAKGIYFDCVFSSLEYAKSCFEPVNSVKIKSTSENQLFFNI